MPKYLVLSSYNRHNFPDELERNYVYWSHDPGQDSHNIVHVTIPALPSPNMHYLHVTRYKFVCQLSLDIKNSGQTWSAHRWFYLLSLYPSKCLWIKAEQWKKPISVCSLYLMQKWQLPIRINSIPPTRQVVSCQRTC